MHSYSYYSTGNNNYSSDYNTIIDNNGNGINDENGTGVHPDQGNVSRGIENCSLFQLKKCLPKCYPWLKEITKMQNI